MRAKSIRDTTGNSMEIISINSAAGGSYTREKDRILMRINVLTCYWGTKTHGYGHNTKHVAYCLRKSLLARNVSCDYRDLTYKASIEKPKHNRIGHETRVTLCDWTDHCAESYSEQWKLVHVNLVDAPQFTKLAEDHSSHGGHDWQNADQPRALRRWDTKIVCVFYLMKGRLDVLITGKHCAKAPSYNLCVTINGYFAVEGLTCTKT